jgi:assimilatory nitrate reductase catalytic subunit
MCPYCGVGCGLLVQVRDGLVTKVKGDPAHPANSGDICAKAVHLPPVLRTADRLHHPQLRRRRDGNLERVPWELALRFTADRMREIATAHGPDAIAFYASGQLLTEEYYVAAKLARAGFGTNNFDTNSRLCMASAAAGYARSEAMGRPPPTPTSTAPTASYCSGATPPTATLSRSSGFAGASARRPTT